MGRLRELIEFLDDVFSFSKYIVPWFLWKAWLSATVFSAQYLWAVNPFLVFAPAIPIAILLIKRWSEQIEKDRHKRVKLIVIDLPQTVDEYIDLISKDHS